MKVLELPKFTDVNKPQPLNINDRSEFDEKSVCDRSNNIFHSCKNDKEKEKERNIDIINFNNGMIHEGETIKEITRNDLKHSPNIGVKISQKSLKFPIQKNNDLIFNINSSSTKFLFSTNKNSNLETKSKIRKTKNENNYIQD